MNDQSDASVKSHDRGKELMTEEKNMSTRLDCNSYRASNLHCETPGYHESSSQSAEPTYSFRDDMRLQDKKKPKTKRGMKQQVRIDHPFPVQNRKIKQQQQIDSEDY